MNGMGIRVLTVAACPLNVKLALRLQNVPTVYGKDVAAGRLQQWIARVLISRLSWLLATFSRHSRTFILTALDFSFVHKPFKLFY